MGINYNRNRKTNLKAIHPVQVQQKEIADLKKYRLIKIRDLIEKHANEVTELKQKTKFFSLQDFGETKANAKSIIIKRLIKCPSGANKTRSLNATNNIKVYAVDSESIPINGGKVYITMEKINPKNPTYYICLMACPHAGVKSIELSFKISLFQNDELLQELNTEYIYERETGLGVNISNPKYNCKLELTVVVEISKCEVNL